MGSPQTRVPICQMQMGYDKIDNFLQIIHYISKTGPDRYTVSTKN